MFSKSKADITYDDIISLENLLAAWEEFICGKRKRIDVQAFQYNLLDNILDLHRDLQDKTYRHGSYEAFNISDPKPRNIHKASVRDRLLHHAIHRVIYLYFEKKFIHDSYSCRVGKGTHKALNRFRDFARIVSQNNTFTVWVLKCDIRKFFASIDHEILSIILAKHISDTEVLWLFKQVMESFHSKPGKGLPLGNLTSQLLVNVYMNELDQWMKHKLKAKYYIRYADDFVCLSKNRQELEGTLGRLHQFLEEKLALQLHPDKVSITTLTSGVDFLGWVHYPYHRVLRTVTKRRMFKNIQGSLRNSPTVQSYLGLLRHGSTYKLRLQVETRLNIAQI